MEKKKKLPMKKGIMQMCKCANVQKMSYNIMIEYTINMHKKDWYNG